MNPTDTPTPTPTPTDIPTPVPTVTVTAYPTPTGPSEVFLSNDQFAMIAICAIAVMFIVGFLLVVKL